MRIFIPGVLVTGLFFLVIFHNVVCIVFIPWHTQALFVGYLLYLEINLVFKFRHP